MAEISDDCLPTLRERNAKVLEDLGYVIAKSMLKRHWIASKPDWPNYYLGSRGHVRRGETLTSSRTARLHLPPI